MILHVMCPSFRISPSFAETKLMGRRGIFMFARAWRASSSMVLVVFDQFEFRINFRDWCSERRMCDCVDVRSDSYRLRYTS